MHHDCYSNFFKTQKLKFVQLLAELFVTTSSCFRQLFYFIGSYDTWYYLLYTLLFAKYCSQEVIYTTCSPADLAVELSTINPKKEMRRQDEKNTDCRTFSVTIVHVTTIILLHC